MTCENWNVDIKMLLFIILSIRKTRRHELFINEVVSPRKEEI